MEPSGEVALRSSERTARGATGDSATVTVAGFAGLATCARIWLCPVCNARIMAERALELGAVLTWAEGKRFRVMFGALTVQHDRSSDLLHLMMIQRKAWYHVVNSRQWRAAKAVVGLEHVHGSDQCRGPKCVETKDYRLSGKGLVGYVRATEITVGENGWHPHFHPVIVWSGTVEAGERFAAHVLRLWIEGVKNAGGYATDNGAQGLSFVQAKQDRFRKAGEYVAKSTYEYGKIALEATSPQTKRGKDNKKHAGMGSAEDFGYKHSTLPYWALLARIARGEHGEPERRWGELEEALDGQRHRQIRWSLGLRALAGLRTEERTDDEIAAEEVGTRDDAVCFITPQGWEMICDEPAILAQLLDLQEGSGWTAAKSFLDGLGVPYRSAQDAAEDVRETSRAHMAQNDRRRAEREERRARVQPGAARRSGWEALADDLLAGVKVKKTPPPTLFDPAPAPVVAHVALGSDDALSAVIENRLVRAS